MEKEKKQKTKSLKLTFPVGAPFPVVFAFNVFGIEKLDVGMLLHFGIKYSAGVLDSFAIFLDENCIEANLQGWTEYLIKIGGNLDVPGEGSFRCPPRVSDQPVSMATTALWSRYGETAELRCYSSSLGDISAAIKDGNEVVQHPLALIRSTRECQASLLGQIIQMHK